MGNAKKLTRHNALDLAVQACQEAARHGYAVYDIDKTRGRPHKSPCLIVKGAKAANGNFVKAARVIPLTDDGLRLDFGNGNPAASPWTRRCGWPDNCSACKNKKDCEARLAAWGAAG